MECLSLLPNESPVKVAGGEGGSYYAWNNTMFPYLADAKISSAILIIQPHGLALPHYADCNKIGYVIEGSAGVAGIIDPITSEEKVVKLKKGDAIFVPGGVVSWWANSGEDELKFIYLGESANDRGQLTYCILTGVVGILKGFPRTTISQAFDLNEEQANEFITSQKEAFILKIGEGKTISNPSNEHTKTLCFNFVENLADINVEKGGSFTTMTSKKHDPLEGIKLSGNYLKLEPNAMFGPIYYAKDSGVQLTYVVKGNGWVRVVAMSGKVVLDAELVAGQVFAVPKFFVVAIGAGDEGIECFSIVNTSEPILSQIAGNASIWSALSPEVLQSSLNISAQFSELFLDKINKTSIIKPAV